MTASAVPGPRPFTVGITGHRVLADPGRLAAGVDEALRRLDEAFPGRVRTVLSSLAEGADRLVSRRALALPGTRLVALLPLPRADFRGDFASEESQREFEALLQLSDEIDEPPSSCPRVEAYEAAERSLLERSDALIAVWDGQTPQGRGGTGAVVAVARRRGLPIAWVHAGNRQPGSLVPTSLGPEQGRVTFESIRDVIPYRIRIGVFGSEAVADRQALVAEVRRALAVRLSELFDPRSRLAFASVRHTPIAYSIVTSLASEAERVVARDLLGLTDSRLEAVLPRRREEYLQGFASSGERQAVEDLIALDRRPLILGVPAKGPALSPEAERRRVIEHILDHADLVMTVGESGAAREALEAALRVGRPLLLISAGPSPAVRVERGAGLSAERAVRLDALNAFVTREDDVRRYVANLDRRLFDSKVGARLDPGARRMVRDRLLPHYARSSLLAKSSQRVYRRAGFAVWALFPAAVAAVALGAVSSGPVAAAAFAAELVCLLAVVGLVATAHQSRSHERWIEYRFLTERIRQASLLAAGGLEASAIEPPPYAGKGPARADWALMAFNEIWNRLPPLPRLAAERADVVRRYLRWHAIRDQVGYHERAAATAGRMSHALERGGAAAFGLAILVAALHLPLTVAGHRGGPLAQATLTFGAIVLPAVGAALGGFRAHREYSRLARRSRGMARGLRRLKRRFVEVSDPDELASLARETERAMLSEAQDWLVLMEFLGVERPG
jgi:hypothetical protein